MFAGITITDYSCDWYLREGYSHPRSTPGDLSMADVVRLYADLGADGIELTDHYWAKTPTAEIKRLVNSAGLKVTGYQFTVDLAQPAHERRAAEDHARRCLDRIAELGARIAHIVPALVKPDATLADQRQWLIAGLQTLAEHAQKLKIILGGENIDWPPTRPFMATASQCRRICEEVDSPAFGLIYDVGATIFADEDAVAALRDMAPYLCHVHLKNARALAAGETDERGLESLGGHWYTGTVFGKGVVDVNAVVDELANLGYQGNLMIEYQGKEIPRVALQENLDFLRQACARLGLAEASSRLASQEIN